ncbi:MAG: hypothetical protein R3254_04815, partial [Thiomicrorhabdus sp.]|nr:hypothetical protein [Thiomicrorhabdus sp.]
PQPGIAVPVMIPENPPITGSIQGTFNGANASHLTGLVDITSNGNNVVGTFMNQKVDINDMNR